MTRLRLLAGALALAVLLGAGAAEAEDTPDPTNEAAQKLYFDEGRSYVKLGRFAEALESFQRSLAIKSGSGILLNIGDCYEKLGRYASALSAFEKAKASAADKHQSDREKEATDRITRIRPIVSSITVTPTALAGTIEIDGRAVLAGSPVSLDGGPHVVKLSVPCRIARERRVEVGIRSDAVTVTFDEHLAEDPHCARPSPAGASTEAPASVGSTQRLIALVTAGAGVVALGIGAGFGIMASGRQSDLEDACPRYPSCAPGDRLRVDGIYDDATTTATIATVGFVSAAVLLEGAAALYLTAPRSARPAVTGSASTLRWSF